jgi:hypothetical protein
MSRTDVAFIEPTPKHLWVVGVLGLIWNAGGAFDYIMTKTKNEAYMSAFTPEQLEFFYGLPMWTVAAWATAVWGSVIATILLLLRRRQAVWVYLVSLIAMTMTAFQNYVLSNGMEVIGDAGALWFTAAIFVIALLLFVYARAMQKRNVLI